MANNIEQGPREEIRPEVLTSESEVQTPEQSREGKHNLEVAEQQYITESQEEIAALKQQLEINSLQEKLLTQEQNIAYEQGFGNRGSLRVIERADKVASEKQYIIKEEIKEERKRKEQGQRGYLGRAFNSVSNFLRGNNRGS